MSRCICSIMLIFSLLFFCSSCSTLFDGRNDLFKTGRYRLAVDEIRGCTLEAVAVDRDGNLIVSGRMTFRHHPEAPLSGAVTGEIVGPEGKHIETRSVPFKAFPHARHLHPAAKFELTFDQIPPPGSLIRLSHTLRPFNGSEEDGIIR